MSDSLAPLAAVLAPALAVLAVLVLRDGSRRRFRAHLRQLGLDSGGGAAAAPGGPDIRAAARSDRGPLRRFAELLGYNPEIPRPYATAWPVVAALAGAAGLLAFWAAGAAYGAVAGAVCGLAVTPTVASLLFRRQARRYRALLFGQIPDAVSLVLRAVRAGLPVSEAIRSIGREMPAPTRDEFSLVVGDTAIGTPLEAALWRLYERTGIREYSFLAVTIGLQAQTGGNLAETLENLAEMVRKRVALASKVRALSAEGRTSAAILLGLPVVGGLGLFVQNPAHFDPFFTNPRGPGFLITLATLLSLGILTIRWLIRKATSD